MDSQRKAEILKTVCGVPEDHIKQIQRSASAYFEYYEEEIQAGPVVAHGNVLFLVQFLRRRSEKKRSQIQSELIDHCKEVKARPSPGEPSRSAESESASASTPEISLGLAEKLLADEHATGRFLNLVLARAVKVMLHLNINVEPPTEYGIGIRWEATDSLRTTVNNVFPLDMQDEDSNSVPIKKNKLRARYLRSRAQVELVWTDTLSDHLKLYTDNAPKKLYVFQYVSMLEAALKRTPVDAITVNVTDMQLPG